MAIAADYRQRVQYMIPLLILGIVQGYMMFGPSQSSLGFSVRSLLQEEGVSANVTSTEHEDHLIPHETPTDKKIDESEKSLSLLLLTGVEFVAFFAAYFLKKTHFPYLQEAGATILFGCVLGAITRFVDTEAAKDMQELLALDSTVFFLFLLPPIIFDSGYSMKRKNFFQNLGGIIAYAFAGTAIATFITGGLLYLVVMTGWMSDLTFLECLIFGSLISAVDPVTVLAIFKELKVDLDLYSNVFGESVLNDAVAIVMYRTVLQFTTDPFSARTFFLAIAQFCIIFAGSCFVGTVVALVCALFFKHTQFFNYPYLETAVLLLFAYASYLIPEGMSLSGIVSVLFCGMIMAHYVYPNLSEKSKDLSTNVSSILALMTETIVFVYLGLALFTVEVEFDPVFIVAAIIIILLARLANIYPLTFLINLARPPNRRITLRYQFFMWFAGLRGAIAFILSMDVPTRHASVMGTTTIMIVFFTVLIEGGLTVSLLKALKIPIGVEVAPIIEEEAYGKANVKVQSMFHDVDSKYLKPFFVRAGVVKKGGDYGHVSENVETVEMTTKVPEEPPVSRAHEPIDPLSIRTIPLDE